MKPIWMSVDNSYRSRKWISIQNKYYIWTNAFKHTNTISCCFASVNHSHSSMVFIIESGLITAHSVWWIISIISVEIQKMMIKRHILRPYHWGEFKVNSPLWFFLCFFVFCFFSSCRWCSCVDCTKVALCRGAAEERRRDSFAISRALAGPQDQESVPWCWGGKTFTSHCHNYHAFFPILLSVAVLTCSSFQFGKCETIMLQIYIR